MGVSVVEFSPLERLKKRKIIIKEKKSKRNSMISAISVYRGS
jgi:hypothetical protein